MFSIEGGRKENMDYIVTVLKHVAYYLENEYVPDEKVYQKFIAQYDEVCAYRNKVQEISDTINKIEELTLENSNKNKLYDREFVDRKKKAEEDRCRISEQIRNIKNSIDTQNTLLLELSIQLRKQQEDREYVNQSIDALALQKPGFFSRKKHKKEYKEKLKEYSDQLQNIILNEHLIKTKETECENQNKDLLGEVNKKKEEINQSQEEAKRYEDSFRADTYLS